MRLRSTVLTSSRHLGQERVARLCGSRSALYAVTLCAVTVLASCLGATPAAAQRPKAAAAIRRDSVIHESWGMNDGLPLNSVNHLVQTRDGYVWAATYDGLVRYDGVRFTVFNSANSPGLRSSSLIYLHEGANGDLWMVTSQRHLIRRRHGRFVVIADQNVVTKQAWPIQTTADGTTWVGTNFGLARVDGDSLLPVRRDLVRDTVVSLLLRRDGSLLVGPARGGLLRLRVDRRGQVTPVAIAADTALAHSQITAMFEAPNRALWLGSRQGVWTGEVAWRRLPVSSSADLVYVNAIVGAPGSVGVVMFAQQRSLLPGLLHPLHSVAATSDGRVVTPSHTSAIRLLPSPLSSTGVATWYGAGTTLYRNGLPLITLSHLADRDAAPYQITAVLADREGSVWVGTYLGGLHRIKPAVVYTISEPEGLRDRNATGTYVDHSGAVWVGTWGKGISRIDPTTGHVQGFSSRTQLSTWGNAFFESRDGTFWVGYSQGDSLLFRCAYGATLTCVEERPAIGRMRGVLAIDEDADGRLWVGATSGAFRRDRDRLLPLDSLSGAPSVPVQAFARAPDGAMWMGTNGGGVVRYSEGVFTAVTTKDGLPSNLIRTLYVDRDGWLWIGTEGRGIARLDTRAWASHNNSAAPKRIATISSREGLYDDATQQILEDDAGRLWISSNRGIFWITRQEAIAVADGRSTRVHSTSYTEREGMRNREANGGVQPAGAKGVDGRLWFPTADGVVVVDPRTIVSDVIAPPLVIEQVVSGDTSLSIATDGVRLSPDKRDIRIDFTALTFLQPRNVRFRYRLNGYDDDWVDNDTRRSAFYTKLPPGRYSFRVQSSASGSEWYEPGAILAITVIPRVDETWWFRVALVSLGIIVLVFAVRHRLSDAHRRGRDLEHVVADRTTALRDREQQLAAQNHQLEAQARALQQLDTARSRFFANVSHELRTPLTLMIAPLDRLRERRQADEQSRTWVELAQRNARRLLALVNQILDVAKLEAGAMKLMPVRMDVSGLLRDAIDSFRLTAERKNLAVALDAPESCWVTLDRDAIDKIVTNLLSNAVKFTPPDGRVALSLLQERDHITLTVVNSGPTIPPDHLALVFERFYQVDESNTTVQAGTGIGLSLVKELAQLQHGTVQATSHAELTTFTVTLPLSEVDLAREVETQTALLETADSTQSVARDEELVDDIPTLLIVDDSDDMRTFIRMHFEDRFRVLEAANGAEGLALARTRLPDVIISDVMMPVLDGRAMVRALRENPETDYLAVVLLTAQADNDQRISGLEGGADDYLVKPFEMRELDVRVRNLIAARQRLRTRFAASLPAVSSGVPATSVRLPSDDTDVVSHADMSPLVSKEDAAYRDRVVAAIAARIGDAEFGVAELAAAVFQDRSHLFRRVRQVTVLSPSDLIRRMRVEEGARLLQSTTGSVADVAFSVGFRSVSHFFRCFHDQYRVTPAEYRSANNAGRNRTPTPLASQ